MKIRPAVKYTVVLLVSVILAAIALPLVKTARDNATERAWKSHAAKGRTATSTQALTREFYPNDALALSAPTERTAEGLYGFVDATTQQAVIPARYLKASERLSDGVGWGILPDRTAEYFTEDGSVLFKLPQWHVPEDFQSGLARVWLGEGPGGLPGYYFVDKLGNHAHGANVQYTYVTSYVDGYARLRKRNALGNFLQDLAHKTGIVINTSLGTDVYILDANGRRVSRKSLK